MTSSFNRNCSWKFHDMYDKTISCPGCSGRGKITVVAENGEPLRSNEPLTFRGLLRNFFVALGEYIIFRARGSK